MRLIRVIFALVLGLITSTAIAAEGTCWVVAVAMEQYGKGQAADVWNQYALEFAKTFKDNAAGLHKSVQVRTVVGKEATRQNILNGLQWLAKNAGPDDFVAFYIGCHGGTAPAGGWSIDTMDKKIVTGREMKEIAARIPCRVLFVIDTCGSGGFAKTHAKDIPLPPNCAAICSCRAQQSTTNHLNVALHEGLWGKGDFNRDGFVTLEELMKYIQARARELLKANADEKELPVIECGDKVQTDVKLTQASDRLVAMLYENNWYLGRVDKEEGEKWKVHAFGYSDDPKSDYFFFNEIAPKRVFKLGGINPQPVRVEVDGKTKAALLVGKEGEGFKVQYPQAQKAKNRDAVVEKSQVEYLFCEDPAVAPVLKKRGAVK